ncbi:MAG: efflux RND transporter permease subunit [Planctomycetota bacterium]
MLNSVIQFALRNRMVILCAALSVIVFGTMSSRQLPIDVLPDLTRPRVTILTECSGMAPEEVEREVTIPIEAVVSGAAGVTSIRSNSDVGLSVVTVEFDWGFDIYRCRQIVSESMVLLDESRWPESAAKPKLGPVSSLLGQIMIIGMWSDPGVDTDGNPNPGTNPIELRTLAEGVVRKRLQNIQGISQVITMGGGLKQYHVLVDIHKMHKFEVTLTDIENAFLDANLNVNGGYIDSNSRELLVRGIGRMNSIDQLKKIAVRTDTDRAILIENVADVTIAATPKRGDSSVNGIEAVVLTVQKQPGVDTRALSDKLETAVEELRQGMPDDVQLSVTYQQREFIDHAVGNVIEALIVGSILVVLVLFLFLFNMRTTLITLTAIPVSVFVTAIVFRWFDLSINVMTLGGIAVALGELVDDAIVDVENIFRRLRQNRRSENPRPVLRVIFEASVEVRNAIIISTILVIVVFAPLFALSGIEGRLFVPLGIAYIVSIIASTVVSLTLTPALSYYLLVEKDEQKVKEDSALVRGLKSLITPLVRISLNRAWLSRLLIVFTSVAIVCGLYVYQMGKNFLPRFDEGATQLNLIARPGTSLSTSREISRAADAQLSTLLRTPENPLGPIEYFTCKTGRAENDEHVMGVNISEYVISLNENAGVSSVDVEKMVEESVENIGSVITETEQPIAHLISHMISGVTSQIAIKIYGDELSVLRSKAQEVNLAIQDIPGIKPPVVEQAQGIPQMQIVPDYDQLAKYKLSAAQVFQVVETAMQGKEVSRMIENELSFKIIVRFPEEYREDVQSLKRLPIELPDGGVIPLSSVALIDELSIGPNTIRRENARRRIVVRVNTLDTDLETAVNAITSRIRERVDLPEGYYVELGGQYEAQQSATSRILLLSIVALVIVIVVLYSTYNSLNIVAQILFSLPVAFIGGVLALWATGQVMTVAAMVGFISLGGIAARNGLLLVGTYRDLAAEQTVDKDLILKGSLERMTPVLMTALTTGIALLPLIIAGHLPGREILFPVATVIAGGLLTSTLCEFLIRPGLYFYFTDHEAPIRPGDSPDDIFAGIDAGGSSNGSNGSAGNSLPRYSVRSNN